MKMNYYSSMTSYASKLSERDFIDYQDELWWDEYGVYDYLYGGITLTLKWEEDYNPMLLGHYEYIEKEEYNLDEIGSY